MKWVLLSQREQRDRYGEEIDVLEAAYARYYEELGYHPVAVSNHCKSVEPFFELELAGVVLTGGGTVPQAYLDEKRTEDAGQPNRDRIEKMLAEGALKRGIPLLGVCRGMQFVNGMLGGKVSRLKFPAGERRNGRDHPVWLGEARLMVNNYHDDGIYARNLAKGLRCIAEDRDFGVVEAFAGVELRILGIQWHPERRFEDANARERTKEMVAALLAGKRTWAESKNEG